jgi:hypothetical protein
LITGAQVAIDVLEMAQGALRILKWKQKKTKNKKGRLYLDLIINSCKDEEEE